MLRSKQHGLLPVLGEHLTVYVLQTTDEHSKQCKPRVVCMYVHVHLNPKLCIEVLKFSCCPQIDNSAEEIADVVNYPNVRYMSGHMKTASSPLEDVAVFDQHWAVQNTCKYLDFHCEK